VVRMTCCQGKLGFIQLCQYQESNGILGDCGTLKQHSSELKFEATKQELALNLGPSYRITRN